MNRPLTLLLGFAAVASLPTPTLAQLQPATNSIGFVRIAPRIPTLPIERAVFLNRTTAPAPAARTTPASNKGLIVPAPKVDETPAVRVRPKDAWLDDQGVRLTPSRVAYKRRF